MNMPLADADPDIRDRYRQSTRASIRSRDPRTRTVAALDRVQAVEKGWNYTSVSVRNLILRDALTLLTPGQTEDLPSLDSRWDFVQIGALQLQLDRLRHSHSTGGGTEAAVAALDRLSSLVQQAEQDTYADFESFREAEHQRFRASATDGVMDDDAALQRYDAWLKRYRPYLVLGVPLGDDDRIDEAEAMIRERIDFYLSKNPEPAHSSHHEDRLWTYVYDVRRRRCLRP